MKKLMAREELVKEISKAAKMTVMFGVYHKLADEIARRYFVRTLGELAYPAVNLGSAAALHALSRFDKVPAGVRELSAVASGVGVGLVGVGLVRYFIDEEPLCWFVANDQIRCVNIDASKKDEVLYVSVNGKYVGVKDFKGGSGNFTITLNEGFGPGSHRIVVVGIRKAYSGVAHL